MSPEIVCFFDDKTNSASYVVHDPETMQAGVIDPVLDYDPVSGRSSTESVEKIAAYVDEKGLTVAWIIETHVHADHLTASVWLKNKTGGKSGIGQGITEVQKTFGALFNVTDSLPADGSQFDEVFADGATFKIGNIHARVMATPGHTPACVTYVIGDACFVGDTMFMPDSGTARCDFPGGSSATLYQSIQKILSLPDETRIFVCHDYKAPGRDVFAWETTVGEQKARNVHVGAGKDQDSFVQLRDARDAQLSMPKLIIPSLQVNMRAGNMPQADENGDVYLKVPINKM